MEKFLRSFVFLFLIFILPNAMVFAESSFTKFGSESLATPEPTGNIAYYYCVGDSAPPLTAGGNNLLWYLTAMGGTGSPTAPTPSTAVKGSKIYYVSQTVGGEESRRLAITVNIDKQFELFCVGVTPNSVSFDFANVGQSRFDLSYTIDGGLPVTRTQTSPSSITISGLSEGQTVVLTVTAVGVRSCVLNPTLTDFCKTKCSIVQTPMFNTPAIPTSYCLNDVVVLPTTSTNTTPITGTWSPFPVDTSTMGTTKYTFSPDPILFPCALKTTSINISIEPIEPDFTDFSICSGDPVSILSNVSSNGISGIWSPTDTVDSSVLGIGTFSFTFTPDAGQDCITPIDTKTINVTVNPSNTILNLNWTVTDAFTKNQIVTVTNPVGANYLYQLDSGPFQTSPIFENVAIGLHSITVNDVNGCSQLTDNNVLVIGYPKFFTPNGDSFNDTWNIVGFEDQLDTRIYIFDRYGKLLKDISASGSGWDGNYTGNPMPASDYWFTVEYSEQGIIKEFKSHFSLKR